MQNLWAKYSTEIPAFNKAQSPVLNRRTFLRVSATLGMGVALTPSALLASNNTIETTQWGNASPHLWINITDAGETEIVVHRSEMGQQILTAIAQIITDELDAEWEKVKIVQAEGDQKYGDQNTDGSRSVRLNMQRLRIAGASYRQMLMQVAAERAGVSVSSCTAKDGVVQCGNGRQYHYAELAEDANRLPLPIESDVKLKPRSKWRYMGKPVRSLTVKKIVAGQARYGIDQDMDNMVHAVIARPPELFGKVNHYDDKSALNVPGVIQTIQLPEVAPPALFQPLGGVAVVATDTWAAIQGRNQLDISWTSGANAQYDSNEYRATLLEAVRKPGTARFSRGEVDEALASGTRIEAEYTTAHLAHSPMEPPAALAVWQDDKLTCWACVQDPQTTRNFLAGYFSMDPAGITVHATLLGGAFGRKSKPDFVVEAALLAKIVGKPVKVTWTREDDLQHGYYHAPSAQRLEGALDSSGRCVALLHRTAFPSIISTFVPQMNQGSDLEISQGVLDNCIAPANFRVETGEVNAHVRIGWLRSVCNNFHAFGAQSFAAELAEAAGRDPRDYLLELIGADRIIDLAAEGSTYDNYQADPGEYPLDTARLKHVVRVAAEKANWGRQMAPGTGLGIAVHRSFLTYVATVIEVAVNQNGQLAIPGIWVAADAGTVINTRHAKDQIGGGVIFGLSNALYGEITASNGSIDQSNFPAWRVMRFYESPSNVEVTLIDSTAPPAGAGEPGTPTAAPALANAIFAATGQRIRQLPMMGNDSDKLFA